MRRGVLFLIVVVVLFSFSVNARDFPSFKDFKASDGGVKVEEKIYDELVDEEEVRVIVILKDSNLKGVGGLNKIKEKIKENQNKVLGNLPKEDFRILHKYKTVNAFSGFLTKKGIKILERNPNVGMIYLDRKAHITLSESLPLINADDVHNLGYTGLGETVCVVDTGVDYLHEDIGNAGCVVTGDISSGTTELELVESPHPYTNSYSNTWTITKPGFSNIAVHFERIDAEADYDFVYIKDAAGNFVQVFTGSYSDVWSISIPGDTIKVNLVTDSSVTDWGFKIDEVLDGTISSTWTNCGQVIGGYDFVNNDYDPIDDQGHGTHVAGIVASQNPTYKGVAPGANIVAAKVLDSSGSGWFSNAAAAIDWCTDNKNVFDISVISMSLGEGGEYNDPATECDPYATAQAISTAVSQGIFVSVASGNEAHTNGISYPACASDATSVGAVYDADVSRMNWAPTCIDQTTEADQIVCFTNRDEILDLLAPGCVTTSLKLNGGTVGYCGTSMATPMVAGAAVLLLEASSSLTPVQIKDALKSTGVNIYDSDTGLTFPRIDTLAAVNSVTEFVDITLIGYPLDFSNLDMNTNDNPAVGNSLNQYKVRVEDTTSVNVDIYHKGDDFCIDYPICSEGILTVSNVKYNEIDDVGTATQLTNNYPVGSYFTNIVPNTEKNLYYWINIPEGQKGGSYTSNIYLKAVKTGT